MRFQLSLVAWSIYHLCVWITRVPLSFTYEESGVADGQCCHVDAVRQPVEIRGQKHDQGHCVTWNEKYSSTLCQQWKSKKKGQNTSSQILACPTFLFLWHRNSEISPKTMCFSIKPPPCRIIQSLPVWFCQAPSLVIPIHHALQTVTLARNRSDMRHFRHSVIGRSFWVTFRTWSWVWCLYNLLCGVRVWGIY